MASKSSSVTSLTDINAEIMGTHILTRLSGPTLASTASASPLLHSMCMNDNIWRDICNSTWNSTIDPRVQATISAFPRGHHSFFSDSFPLLSQHHQDYENKYRRRGPCSTTPLLQVAELISAVDIHYKNKPVYSKADLTSPSDSFLDSTFRVELFGQKELVRIPVKYEDDKDICFSDLKENMTLSWIIIDPIQKKAVNVSSLRPVTVRRHWVDGDIEVKYASVVAGNYNGGMLELVELRVVVMLGWKEEGELELRKVNLQVLDMDGNCLSGKASLGILQEAIKSGKRVKAKKGEETERYRKYVDMKRQKREGKLTRRRGTLVPVAATIFVSLIFMFILCLFYVLFPMN